MIRSMWVSEEGPTVRYDGKELTSLWFDAGCRFPGWGRKDEQQSKCQEWKDIRGGVWYLLSSQRSLSHPSLFTQGRPTHNWISVDFYRSVPIAVIERDRRTREEAFCVFLPASTWTFVVWSVLHPKENAAAISPSFSLLRRAFRYPSHDAVLDLHVWHQINVFYVLSRSEKKKIFVPCPLNSTYAVFLFCCIAVNTLHLTSHERGIWNATSKVV